MKGVCGRLLEINLTEGKTKDYSISDDLLEKYLGGRGLGIRLLFDMLPEKTDPLSPENVLFFLTGPLTGTTVPGSSKFVVVTKSPLTNAWCDSYSTGKLSIELKKVGYDGLVIRGKSNHPCYLKIDNDGVHIREAGLIWGKDSFEVEKIIKEVASATVTISKILCLDSSSDFAINIISEKSAVGAASIFCFTAEITNM